MSATEVSSHVRLDERGVAWIDETRVKVIEVAMDWLANRSSAEEMHLQYHWGLSRAIVSYYRQQLSIPRLNPGSYRLLYRVTSPPVDAY
jgi:hypothetical protein